MKGKSNKDRGGSQPPRRSNRGTTGTTKSAAGTIICRNFCPPTQVNLNKKEGARELCGVATAGQCLSQQPLAETQYSAEK